MLPRPSEVVTCLPATASTPSVQEKLGTPSSSTMQEPHFSSPQPKRGPERPRGPRSACSRLVPSGTSTLTAAPFKEKLVIPP